MITLYAKVRRSKLTFGKKENDVSAVLCHLDKVKGQVYYNVQVPGATQYEKVYMDCNQDVYELKNLYWVS